MSTQPPKIRSNWWYTLPIFLGVIGGVIAWFALKSYDRKLAKNCLILGIVFVLVETLIFVTFLMYSDNLNIITEYGAIFKTDDFDIQFKFNTP